VSVRENSWIYKEADDSVVNKLQAELKIHPILCKLLVQRGIHTYKQAKDFFRPSYNQLHDPFLMKDMDKALYRVSKAIENNEKILIYGDYDVDGTTAISLVYIFFSEFYDNLEIYVPNRYTEGYGVSMKGVQYAIDNEFSLIICLDCGIKAIKQVQQAKDNGVDFIICDHHTPGPVLPPAYAVLDPKRKDCEYPYKELSGCGVGFKLVQGYARHHEISEEKVYDLLDLLVVSIASDIVPITGENRVLAHFGLKKLNNNPRPGFKTLIELSNSKGDLSVTDIVFVIGPRINAAGRMDDARHAVNLLISDHNETAFTKANILHKHNSDRKEIDSNITQEALSMIDESDVFTGRKSTVVFNEEWHKGVIGIVASRLIEKHYKPTVVLTASNGKATGSCRSVPGFNIYEALEKCTEHLDQFGGHMYAAGLTMPLENIPAFKACFDEVVSSTITDELLTPRILVDSKLNLEDIEDKFFNILQQFAPFGPANMKPVFVSEHVIDAGYTAVVGENHLKLYVKQNNSRYSTKGIAFGMAEKLNLFSDGKGVNLCYNLDLNEYNGKKSIQLSVKDIKASTVNEHSTKSEPASQTVS